jgi:asparagine synthase (glutamine-hydrolysing)
MCGIAGIFRFDHSPVHHEDIEKILNKLAHRGNDYVAITIGSKTQPGSLSRSSDIGLGHRRLSIIDLDVAGAQPMSYADNKLSVSYNGEIYNYLELKDFLQKKSYEFKTNTDTEVLLAAYHYWEKPVLIM